MGIPATGREINVPGIIHHIADLTLGDMVDADRFDGDDATAWGAAWVDC